MNAIQIFRPEDEIPLETAVAIVELTRQVWPPDEGTPPPDVAEIRARWKERGAFIVVRQDNTVIAHAQIFRREIKIAQGILPAGALAGVCVHPEQRGHGYGAEVVRTAFKLLPEINSEVSLFQTGVPQFYQKLGARLIQNPLFDGTREDGKRENPFWEPNAMIYPATFHWPEGEIDLNGPGF